MNAALYDKEYDAKITLNIADIVDESYINGPGKRAVIWLQGCTIRCPGCWNARMHDHKQRNMISIEDIEKAVTGFGPIEGITILGGEPLQQPVGVLNLIRMAKAHGLTVMLYTGYYEHEIKNSLLRASVELSDIVVFGRYVEKERSTWLKWRGSSNQYIVFRNGGYERAFGDTPENSVEIHISESGELALLGYPGDDLKDEVMK